MSAETTQALLEVARLVAAGIVGGLIASFATHKFTVNRERHTRMRKFRAFVAGLKAECEPHQHPRNFASFYPPQKVSALRCAAANIEDDFRGERRKRFDGLVDAAARAGDDGQQRVIAALDAILDFLK
jgi:hypothetical protein